MNIVITGASRGIGYELVKLLSHNTTHTIIATARNKEKIEKLKEECLYVNPSAKIIPVVCDLSNEASVNILFGAITKHFSTVDILINNAGAMINKPFEKISLADLQYVYEVNVFAVMRLIQLLLPLLSKSQRAHVVNIGSMGGFQGSTKFPGLSAYSSSKAALASLTECLSEEYKNTNIVFNCLALGAAQTEMLNEAFPGYKAPITAKQMATFILDFALSAHNYMNGKIVPVSLSTP